MSEAKPGKAAKQGGKKKLLLPLAAVLLLAGAGAGAWFSGVLPRLLGRGAPAAEAHAESPKPAHGEAAKPAHGEAPKPAHGEPKPAEAKPAHGAKPDAKPAPEKTEARNDNGPFMELPDIVTNLNNGSSRRATFLKLKARLELANPGDQGVVQAAMPRVLDLFQGYLREMRPEELRGTAGTYRLREELLARTNLAVPGVQVVSVLFTEILVQ